MVRNKYDPPLSNQPSLHFEPDSVEGSLEEMDEGAGMREPEGAGEGAGDGRERPEVPISKVAIHCPVSSEFAS